MPQRLRRFSPLLPRVRRMPAAMTPGPGASSASEVARSVIVGRLGALPRLAAPRPRRIASTFAPSASRRYPKQQAARHGRSRRRRHAIFYRGRGPGRSAGLLAEAHVEATRRVAQLPRRCRRPMRRYRGFFIVVGFSIRRFAVGRRARRQADASGARCPLPSDCRDFGRLASSR